MNILVVGQSHVAAIRAAAKARREAEPDRPRTRVIHTLEPRYAPETVDGAFGPALAAAIVDQIERHRPRLTSVIGGNAHNALALIRHPRPWDFGYAGENPTADAEPIPRELVRAALDEALAGDFARLGRFRAFGTFVQVESPPPVRDEAWIAARAEAWFTARGLAARGVAPAPLRLKVWRLACDLVRAEATRLGCAYLPTPAEAQDEDGYLCLDFAGDATHGNARYGEAVIAAIEALV